MGLFKGGNIFEKGVPTFPFIGRVGGEAINKFGVFFVGGEGGRRRECGLFPAVKNKVNDNVRISLSFLSIVKEMQGNG